MATFAPQAEGILGSNLDLQGVKMVGFYYEFDIVGTSTGGGMYLTGFRAEGTPGTPVLTGDLDGDGFVGINDLNLVLGNWNLNVPPGNSLADPSGDGFVGIEDLNTVLGNWNAGTPPPANAVPEPTTLGLMGLVGLAVSCRRR
ncbi:MAG: PEP-CTERM sorting domain-containing protein [Gammaproteobacteria bacterium]|nr:MAG: PEP-CTERM sorting domain-containing protein [Gammaproteobacteria bacterium]